MSEGTAFNVDTDTYLLVSFMFYAYFSQAPGPVFKTVFIPLLKSFTPVEVEIPAPVNEMKCSEVLIMSAKSWHF